MTLSSLTQMGLMLVVLLFSVIIHEVAHGYVAWLNGDPTARLLGRVTLNPLPHIDPVGTILFPLLMLVLGAGFILGWARPVPVDPRNFQNQRLGNFTTSAAGPLSNLLLAVGFSYLLQFRGGGPGLVLMCYYGCIINIYLALFNLLPIPPLDGSHLVAAFLPEPLARVYRYLEPVGFIIIIVLFASGLLQLILSPLFRLIAGWLKVPLVF